MLKKIFILFCVVSSNYLIAQTGIGTVAPINKLDIFAPKADPATTGATSNGNLRLGASNTGNHVLDFGVSSSSTYSWMQARDRTAYGTFYNLLLNPNGGNVGIGTTAPTTKLFVNGDISFNGLFYAFAGSGGFKMEEGIKSITFLLYNELNQYDLTNTLQVKFDVRTFNNKLGIYKDASNINI